MNDEAALMVRVASSAAARLAVPVTAGGLRDAVAAGLRASAGFGRVVVPGDRITVMDRDGPDVVEIDVTLRGRFAGRVHAAVATAAWDADPDPAPAVLRALGAVAQRANAGFVVAAAPAEVFSGPWADAFRDRPRGTAGIAGGDHGLGGLRVPARLSTVLVANAPVAGSPGWAVRAYRVDGEGAEVTL